MEPFQIGGPLYFIGSQGIATYLVKTPAGLVVVGGGMPKTADAIAASITKLGMKVEDVKLILVPHAHFDHVGSLAEMKKRTKAKVLVMKEDAELLRNGGATDYLFSGIEEFRFDPVEPDQLLKNNEKVALGGIEFIAHHTPGHTPGCTTWETTIEAAGKKSVVFADCVTVNVGTHFSGTKGTYNGIETDFKVAFDVLSSLKPDIFLSYHAEFFDFGKKWVRSKKGEGVKPWVDPKGYARQIKQKKAEFEALPK